MPKERAHVNSPPQGMEVGLSRLTAIFEEAAAVIGMAGLQAGSSNSRRWGGRLQLQAALAQTPSPSENSRKEKFRESIRVKPERLHREHTPNRPRAPASQESQARQTP